MSSNFSLDKQKCWSCEYFQGAREVKEGLLSGVSIKTSDTGICGCARSREKGKRIRENDWCAKYQRWSAIQAILDTEAQKKEAERVKREQRRIQERLARQQGTQSHAPGQSPAARPQQRYSFQASSQQRKPTAESKLRKLSLSKKEKRLASLKRHPLYVMVVSSVIGLLAFLVSWCPYWLALALRKTENSNPNGVLWIPFVVLPLAIVGVVYFSIKEKRDEIRLEDIKTLERLIEEESALSEEVPQAPEESSVPGGNDEESI